MRRIHHPFAVEVAIAVLLLGVLACSAAAGAFQATAGRVIGWPGGTPASSNTVTAIAAGEPHNCAIVAGTGAVTCWGNNDLGKATPPASVKLRALRSRRMARRKR